MYYIYIYLLYIYICIIYIYYIYMYIYCITSYSCCINCLDIASIIPWLAHGKSACSDGPNSEGVWYSIITAR